MEGLVKISDVANFGRSFAKSGNSYTSQSRAEVIGL